VGGFVGSRQGFWALVGAIGVSYAVTAALIAQRTVDL